MKQFVYLCLIVLTLGSCVATQRLCINQMDRWSSGNELYLNGPVKTVRVDEQVFESEGHFLHASKTPYLKERFEFDRNGRRVESYDYALDGRELPKTTDIYNEKNWLIRQDTYSALTKKPHLETRYSYDKDGNILEAAQYSLDDNKLLQKWNFVHDPTKNYFVLTDIDSQNRWNGQLGFLKDANCRVYEMSAFSKNGTLAARITLSYDNGGIPVASVTSNAAGKITETRKVEYEFDSRGNWIKKSDFAQKTANGNSTWKLMNIVYRRIEYYN